MTTQAAEPHQLEDMFPTPPQIEILTAVGRGGVEATVVTGFDEFERFQMRNDVGYRRAAETLRGKNISESDRLKAMLFCICEMNRIARRESSMHALLEGRIGDGR